VLVLKHLRRWTYEQLEWEVNGTYVCRRFCRIDGGDAPDEKTMVRYGQLLDDAFLKMAFERVVELASDRGVTAGRRMRVDTTVVEAPIKYPTDSGLCGDAVRVLSREMRKLDEVGTKLPFVRADVRRSVARRQMEIAQAFRRRGDAAKAAIVRPYRRLLRVTKRVIRQAKVARKAAIEAMAAARA
jgi:IS5 family transposase